VGDEGVSLCPALERALADQVDERLAEKEKRSGHGVNLRARP